MAANQRILLAVALLIVDWLIFFIPLSALFLAYILIFNPPWFRGFLERSADKGGGR